MKKYSDKELADYILERRRNGGRMGRQYYKTGIWRWFLYFSFIVLLLVLGVVGRAWGFWWFAFGLLTGLLSRDRVWFRMQQTVWPFYAKVIDWVKVEQIANGQPPTSEDNSLIKH
jgi:hypothetical protein